MNRTYASYVERLSVEQLNTYIDICELLKSDWVPDKIDGEYISCHQVCELLVSHPCLENKVTHIKGRFNQADHSWLVISTLKPGVAELIVDVYPWCSVLVAPLLLIKCSVTDAWYVPLNEEKKGDVTLCL